MEAMSHTMEMWEDEAIIILLVMLGIVLLNHIARLRKGHNASLTFILGMGLACAGAILYYGRGYWRPYIKERAMVFGLLYVWCVLGLWFFAGRDTAAWKLLLGFALQGAVIYGIYVYL